MTHLEAISRKIIKAEAHIIQKKHRMIQVGVVFVFVHDLCHRNRNDPEKQEVDSGLSCGETF